MDAKVCKIFGIHESWYNFFQDNTEVLQTIVNKIDSGKKYYPNKVDIFKVFRLPLSEIKVIVVGMDPYPQGLATGIAFAVPEGKRASSLDIIMDELVIYTNDITIDSHFDYSLESWLDRGVFLLNSALTVEAFNIGSHQTIWEEFMNNLFTFINDNTSGLVVVFMGSVAKRFESKIDESLHYKLFTVHPNADHYNKNKQFIGSKIFKKIDDILWKNHKEKIQWL